MQLKQWFICAGLLIALFSVMKLLILSASAVAIPVLHGSLKP